MGLVVSGSSTGGSGLPEYKDFVRACTTVALPAYTRTTNVLTANANGALPTIDAVTLLVGDRLLLVNGASNVDNGIYTVTALGSAGATWSLTRASDMAASSDLASGAMGEVKEGSVNQGKVFVLLTPTPTLNTTGLTFTVGGLVSGIIAIANGGTGLGAAGAANTVPVSNGSVIAYQLLVDANIDPAAAIATSKLAAGGAATGQALLWSGTAWAASTNFGAQNLTTTGALIHGTNPASQGGLRMEAGGELWSRNFSNTGDIRVFQSANPGGSNNVQIFGDATNSSTYIDSGSSGGAGVQLRPGGTQKWALDTTQVKHFVSQVNIDSSISANVVWRIVNTPTTPFSWAIRGQGSTNAVATNGGDINVQGGKPGSTGLRGPVRLQLNPDDTTFQSLLELAEVVANQRVLALCKGANLASTDMPANTGDRVIFVANAGTNPTASAVGGGILYASAGTLRWRGSAGTDSLIAAA